MLLNELVFEWLGREKAKERRLSRLVLSWVGVIVFPIGRVIILLLVAKYIAERFFGPLPVGFVDIVLGYVGFRLLRDEPVFNAALLTQICRNIRDLTGRVVEFSTLPVNARIQAELLRLTATKGQAHGEQIIIPDLPTHADFAARLSTHREAVTREINRLVKSGVLAKSPIGLAVVNVSALRDLVRKASER